MAVWKVGGKMNPYEMLGIKENATEAEIKSAHRRQVKKYHPDVSKYPRASKKFKIIQEAYEMIKNGYTPTPEPSNPYRDDWFTHYYTKRREYSSPLNTEDLENMKEYLRVIFNTNLKSLFHVGINLKKAPQYSYQIFCLEVKQIASGS